MKNEETIIKELSARYGKKESTIRIMVKIAREDGYSLRNFEKLIKEFLLIIC